jgi:hypothetical protein
MSDVTVAASLCEAKTVKGVMSWLNTFSAFTGKEIPWAELIVELNNRGRNIQTNYEVGQVTGLLFPKDDGISIRIEAIASVDQMEDIQEVLADIDLIINPKQSIAKKINNQTKTKGPYWTEAEDALLIDGTIGMAQLSRKLGRSKSAIYGRRNVLKKKGVIKVAEVSGIVRSNHRSTWAPHEDMRITESSLTNRQLAVELNRTIDAIRSRKKLLRRTRTNGDTK